MFISCSSRYKKRPYRSPSTEASVVKRIVQPAPSAIMLLISLRPVHPSVPFRHRQNLFLQLFRQFAFYQTPLPVFAQGGRLVHTAPVIQSHIVLHGDDAHPGVAAHDQRNERLIQLLRRRVLVAQIVSGHLPLFLCNALKPACDRLVVMGPRI